MHGLCSEGSGVGSDWGDEQPVQRGWPMTVPPPIPPRTSPPRYRVLDDAWEAPPSNKPRRLRVVVVAASIGTALIMACVAILKSSERTDAGDASAWVRPAPPPYAISRDTTPLLNPVELPPPQAALESPARPARPAPPTREPGSAACCPPRAHPPIAWPTGSRVGRAASPAPGPRGLQDA